MRVDEDIPALLRPVDMRTITNKAFTPIEVALARVYAHHGEDETKDEHENAR